MPITTPQEVIRTQVATHNAASPVGAEVMSNQMGRNARTGESVQATPQQSDLSDAMEELGMAAATRGKGDLDKMKMRRSQGANFEALARIAEYYDKLPDLPKDQKLRDLVARMQQFEELLQGGGGSGDDMPTADDILKALRDYDGDITHQFAALEEMRATAQTAGASPAFIALLDTARNALRDPDTARDISAGFAAAREAAEAGHRFGADPQAYRDSYRTLLRETPNLGRLFDEFRKFSLTDSFDQVVDSFMKVAGGDLASTGPSTDPVVLNMLLTELGHLKSLRSVLDATGQMLGKVDRMFPATVDTARPGAEDLTSRLFHLAGSPVASMTEVEGLLAGFDAGPPEMRVVLINLLRDLHATLPDQVMHSDQSREQQSRLLMTLSDRLVDIEEAAYEG
ncbi:type III secretion system gatekeeper subunit SctW [Pseudooceanicola aestuarii]|uniref:type III secretion system gatekeeper subunit SctW n=1 Tax=Pseudooceanicola aestuarii TaxID=2697319 RepID=UPI0013D4B284|nr:type III secretion system gatekeeper subunit SctW [Pseudooceanicola aestuarii]